MAKNSKIRSLPFVVQPRLKPILEQVGTELSGIIEVERRGYLSVAEKAWVQTLEAEDGTQGRLHRLAIKVGSELNMDPREALDLISTSQMEDPRLEPFHEELMVVLSEMTTFQSRRRIISATCLLVSRVDPEWDVEDTMKLHEDIIEGLDNLYNEEDARSVAALEAATTDEDEEADAKGKD